MFVALLGCGSDASDLLDVTLNPPDRKPIDPDRTGVNNFFVDSQFGDISTQAHTIRDTLKLHFVRVLFAWTSDVQSSPDADPNYSFYDSILDNIPSGVDVLVVLSHTPNWMTDSNNWIGGDPRETWVQRWLKPTVQRYAGNGKIIGYEIFNEPDLITVASDTVLGVSDPNNYFQMLNSGSSVIRSIDPTKLVLNAATRSIQQDFPNPLNFNRDLKNLGAEALVDVWNVHYYGKQFDNFTQGVDSFLGDLGVPIWVTESGEQGPTQQLAYVETVWPFLDDQLGAGKIQRFYYYQFASPEPVDQNYGIFTTNSSFPISDLGIFLKDR